MIESLRFIQPKTCCLLILCQALERKRSWAGTLLGPPDVHATTFVTAAALRHGDEVSIRRPATRACTRFGSASLLSFHLQSVFNPATARTRQGARAPALVSQNVKGPTGRGSPLLTHSYNLPISMCVAETPRHVDQMMPELASPLAHRLRGEQGPADSSSTGEASAEVRHSVKKASRAIRCG